MPAERAAHESPEFPRPQLPGHELEVGDRADDLEARVDPMLGHLGEVADPALELLLDEVPLPAPGEREEEEAQDHPQDERGRQGEAAAQARPPTALPDLRLGHQRLCSRLGTLVWVHPVHRWVTRAAPREDRCKRAARMPSVRPGMAATGGPAYAT